MTAETTTAFRRRFTLGSLFAVGARRKPTGWLFWMLTVPAFGLAAWVIWAAAFDIIQPWTLAVVFISGMMALAFLVVAATPNPRTSAPTILDWILCAIAVATGIYFTLNAAVIEQRIVLMDELGVWNLVFGSALFLLTLEITRRTTGMGLMLVVLIFVAYNLLGHQLGGVLKHGYISYSHFIEITVFTTDGILGLPVRVAATYAFLFVLFGTVLMAVGGGDFFFNFASAISGRRTGGPAKVAVVSSGLYGMVSGSPTSDVVTTGSITIPIMKRLGYGGTLAGAVEVSASTGGSLLPPVMGSAAFLMAEYTGIDYAEIAIAALIPALLYYLAVYAQVHFRSLKLGLKPLDSADIPKMGPTLKDGGMFLVPLVVLTAVLLMGYTPTRVAVIGTAAILVVAILRIQSAQEGWGSPKALAVTTWRFIPLIMLIVGLIIEYPLQYLALAVTVASFIVSLSRMAAGKQSQSGLVASYRVLAETSFRMIPVAGACAAAGLVIGGITMTGLAAKFAHVVYGMTEAQVFPALLVAAGLTIILGLGMPTPSAYILAAMLMGPLMKQLGVPDLGGHMFLLYFAVMSAITPPVAVAAYAASSIAEANPLAIAGLAVKFALAAFIVPFAFVYQSGLLMQGGFLDIVIPVVTTIIGVVAIALAMEGYLRGPIKAWARWLIFAAGICLITDHWQAIAAGFAVLAMVWVVPQSGVRPRETSQPTSPQES